MQMASVIRTQMCLLEKMPRFADSGCHSYGKYHDFDASGCHSYGKYHNFDASL